MIDTVIKLFRNNSTQITKDKIVKIYSSKVYPALKKIIKGFDQDLQEIRFSNNVENLQLLIQNNSNLKVFGNAIASFREKNKEKQLTIGGYKILILDEINYFIFFGKTESDRLYYFKVEEKGKEKIPSFQKTIKLSSNEAIGKVHGCIVISNGEVRLVEFDKVNSISFT